MPDGAVQLSPDLMRRLERLRFRLGRVSSGRFSGEERSSRVGESIEFKDYRSYLPGDEVRRVDWHAFARLERLYVKLFVEEVELRIALLIDASSSMVAASFEKWQACQSALAGLGFVGLASHNRVWIYAMKAGTIERWGPYRGKAMAPEFFSQLSAIQPAGPTDLAGSTRRFVLDFPAGGLALFASDFLDPAGPEPSMTLLRESGKAVAALEIHDPEEITPSLSGPLRLLDSETQSPVEVTVDRATLKAYDQSLKAHLDRVKRCCNKRDIPHLLHVSNSRLDEFLLKRCPEAGVLE